jgi:hypothetical protein
MRVISSSMSPYFEFGERRRLLLDADLDRNIPGTAEVPAACTGAITAAAWRGRLPSASASACSGRSGSASGHVTLARTMRPSRAWRSKRARWPADQDLHRGGRRLVHRLDWPRFRRSRRPPTPKCSDTGLLDWPTVLKLFVKFDLDQGSKASDQVAGGWPIRAKPDLLTDANHSHWRRLPR